MTEDNDLSGIDLDDLDFGDDADLGEGGDIDLGEMDAADDSGGDDIDLGDLDAADDSGGDDFDLGDLDAAGDSGGDDDSGSSDFDADLADVLGGEGDAGGEDAPAADAASAPAAPAAPTVQLTKTEATNLEFLLDINLHVTFEVGRSKMVISDLLTLGQGSVVELHRLVGDELDLLVNGRLIAKGEVIVVNEKFGCKITEIVSPDERIRHLANI